MSDREEFQEARTAGLRARHETREARAIRKQAVDEVTRRLLVALGAHGEATLDNGARVRVLPEAVLRDVCASAASEIGAQE